MSYQTMVLLTSRGTPPVLSSDTKTPNQSTGNQFWANTAVSLWDALVKIQGSHSNSTILHASNNKKQGASFEELSGIRTLKFYYVFFLSD